MLVAGLISLISMQSAGVSSIALLEESIRTDYDTNIKEQVNNVISLLQIIYDDQQEGLYTEEEAKN